MSIAMENNSNNIHHINLGDKEITLLGTAHISQESVRLVTSVIEKEKPDTVCVELCESRYHAIREKEKWQEQNIIKVIKEKKALLLLSNLLLASFQKRIAEKFDIQPGAEMISAIETAEAVGAGIHLADRDIRITLSRTWRAMGLWDRLKLLFQLVLSLGQVDEIDEDVIEKMKQEDVLATLLADIGKALPVIKDILIDERDKYLAHKIKTAPGNKIVAVVGAGHVPGIKKYFQVDTDIETLEQLPPKSKISGILKWGIPAAIFGLFIFSFIHGGIEAGTDMLTWWILANGLLAGAGAIIALAHPLTVGAAILAAPLTSLNPMIAAGWVAGLVEVILSKPKVKDFEKLQEDIRSIRGFWKNRITRILLVVVFTNLGSTIGTFVAFPFMARVLQGVL